jgi:hypothetical protein
VTYGSPLARQPPALSGDSAWGAAAGEQITPEVFLVRGPVNGVLPGHQGETLAIYGDSRQSPPATKWVLLTHHRRDFVWAGTELVRRGARAVCARGGKGIIHGCGQILGPIPDQAISRLRQSFQPHPGGAAALLNALCAAVT